MGRDIGSSKDLFFRERVSAFFYFNMGDVMICHLRCCQLTDFFNKVHVLQLVLCVVSITNKYFQKI